MRTLINASVETRPIGWLIVCILFFPEVGKSQTKIDLSAQSKNIDFSLVSSTKPVQVGIILPPTCGIGQMFFSSTASPGQNLYLCAATNTWTQLSSSVVGGTTSSFNFVAGFGIALFSSTLGGVNTVQIGVDQAVILTRAAAQTGISTFCRSNNGTTDYTCRLTPTLSAYTGPSSSPPGSTCLVFYVDTPNTKPVTINVDTLGAVPILGRSGGALNPGDIPAGQPVTACYNDSAFILQR